MTENEPSNRLSVQVNGVRTGEVVPGRLTLADYLRDRRGLTGTKVGCEQGVCGACTVLLDGCSVRSCLVLAAQADESDVVTVEGLTEASPAAAELRMAFARHDAVQCGFCTPGFLVAGVELLNRERLDEPTVRTALSGNLCRCTGYGGIVAAVLEVHGRLGAVPITAPTPGPPTGTRFGPLAEPRGPVHRLAKRRTVVGALLLAGAVAAAGLLIRRLAIRLTTRMEGIA